MFNLPLQGMSKAVAKLLGNQAGRFVEVEKDDNGSCLGRFLNVRVIVDINKPLRRGAKVRIGSGGHTIWVDFRYVRLPDFCFWCGKIGHTMADCFEEIPDKVRRGKQEPNYGAWLRGWTMDKPFKSMKSGRSHAIGSTCGGSHFGGTSTASGSRVTQMLT
ncbi:Zinc knuckle CX2CX4HX4C [Trema orientale]|uniref:Zinc knuckle CX2CX4HX4C n=1 Tax=Trema orientale TaxID=63057 RepID=A0A2P5F2Z2_TREOI|nr:Zinc knuckle CX2CX4HX4C [Trema orientale]